MAAEISKEERQIALICFALLWLLAKQTVQHCHSFIHSRSDSIACASVCSLLCSRIRPRVKKGSEKQRHILGV